MAQEIKLQLNDLVETKNDNPFESTPQIDEQPKKSKKSKIGIIITVILSIICLFMVFVLIFTLTVTVCEVNERSMMPTLEHNSHVLLVNRPRNIERGDIITVNTPYHYRASHIPQNQRIELFIKRVIALPGDTVIWRVSNTNYITFYDASNRQVTLPEIYLYLIKSGTTEVIRLEEEVGIDIYQTMVFNTLFNATDFTYIDGYKQKTYTVADGYIYILGDNRNNSVDSRRYSFSRNDVTGRMFHILEPDSSLERLLLWLYG